MRGLYHRIYNDFFMRSRITALENELLRVRSAGYQIISLEKYLACSVDNAEIRKQRLLLLRHDIDTDANTARAIWDMERKHGICGSFYFRLSTVDVNLMRDMHRAGAEVGYHFEEIATLIKRRGTYSDRAQLFRDADALFRKNLSELRIKTELPICGVASHGDFVNRKLGIINNEFLNPLVRHDLNLLYEAYDTVITSRINSRIADRMYPLIWYPEPPLNAINRGDPIIQLLIHPRQWRSAPWMNFVDNSRRVIEGVKFRWMLKHAGGGRLGSSDTAG